MTENRIHQLEEDVARLMKEVDRYRTATDDTLQQLNWCIGYLTGTKQGRLAKSSSANREHIRRNLLNRPPQPVPTTEAERDEQGPPT